MKLLYISNSDWNLYLFRLPLARRIRDAGHEVVMAASRGNYANEIEEAGFKFRSVEMTRSGVHPFVELRSIATLTQVIRDEDPDIVHTFTAKGVLYGALAARLASTRRIVNSITGLGYVFSSDSPTARLLRPLVKQWYKLVLRGTDVVFQNPDDLQFFVENGIARQDRSHLILSSGVDTDAFRYSAEPAGTPIVMFVGRMLWMKGIREFVDAAKELSGRAKFVLVGDTDEGHPSAVPRERLADWDREGVVEWWGLRDDVPDVLAQCHVYCMPTAGREGVPRGLLEAASVGRPLVATDVRGCREIVRHGENGFLVAVDDPDALREALETLIEDAGLRTRMGRRARGIAESEFSVDEVANQTLKVYAAGRLHTSR